MLVPEHLQDIVPIATIKLLGIVEVPHLEIFITFTRTAYIRLNLYASAFRAIV
jgi:hypothetical protein